MEHGEIWEKGINAMASFLDSERCTDEYVLRNGPHDITKGRELQKELRAHIARREHVYRTYCTQGAFAAARSQREHMAQTKDLLAKVEMLTDHMEDRYCDVRQSLSNVVIVSFERSA